MRNLHKLLLIPALVGGLTLTACTAEVEDEGSLPEVDVRGGEMPDIDVNPAQVNISADTSMVVTPDVDLVPVNP